MNTEQILMLIFIPLGILAFIALLMYIFGNVYNGLVKRRDKVRNSWEQLTKTLLKSFEYIPAILQDLDLTAEQAKTLQDIYNQYRTMDLLNSAPREVYSLFAMYDACLEQLSKIKDEGGVLEFVSEHRRLTIFSVPLYNANVKDYMHFRNLFINRSLSKMFKFEVAEYFRADQQHSDTTVSFNLERKKNK